MKSSTKKKFKAVGILAVIALVIILVVQFRPTTFAGAVVSISEGQGMVGNDGGFALSFDKSTYEMEDMITVSVADVSVSPPSPANTKPKFPWMTGFSALYIDGDFVAFSDNSNPFSTSPDSSDYFSHYGLSDGILTNTIVNTQLPADLVGYHTVDIGFFPLERTKSGGAWYMFECGNLDDISCLDDRVVAAGGVDSLLTSWNYNKGAYPAETLAGYEQKYILDYETNDMFSAFNPMARSEIYIAPPPCFVDPVTEMIAFDNFVRGDIIQESSFTLTPKRHCYELAPRFWNLNTGEIGMDFDITTKLKNGQSHTVEIGYIYKVPYIIDKAQLGYEPGCVRGEGFDASEESCERISGFVDFCPAGKELEDDNSSTDFGTCITPVTELCPIDYYFNPVVDDNECFKDVCEPLGIDVLFVNEFEKCGELIPFPDACTYGLGESYDWASDSCLWEMGRDANPFDCNTTGGIYSQVENPTGSDIFYGTCTLPPNPVLPSGTNYDKGVDRLWAVYPTLPDCPTGDTYNNAGACLNPLVVASGTCTEGTIKETTCQDTTSEDAGETITALSCIGGRWVVQTIPDGWCIPKYEYVEPPCADCGGFILPDIGIPIFVKYLVGFVIVFGLMFGGLFIYAKRKGGKKK